MAEKDKITTQKLKYKGTFDYSEVYKFMYDWLVEEEYVVEEQKYDEAILGDSKDVKITWMAEKKISDYFKNEIKLDFKILGLKDVEVEKEGKRIKINKGGFEVKIVGNLTKDWESTWENNPMMKFFRGIYDKYIIEGTIKEYSEVLVEDIEELIEETKAFLTISAKK